MKKTMLSLLIAMPLIIAVAGCGGGDKPKTDGGKTSPKDHVHAKDETHKDESKHPAHSGKVIALGDGTFGAYKVKATRDEAPIKAGGDAPIDVWVDPAAATAPKVVGVRFWIGTEDAKGSAKAKAEIEDAKDPNRWHTHAEVPDPMPAGAKLWVEIEDDKGATTLASFDLKA